MEFSQQEDLREREQGVAAATGEWEQLGEEAPGIRLNRKLGWSPSLYSWVVMGDYKIAPVLGVCVNGADFQVNGLTLSSEGKRG